MSIISPKNNLLFYGLLIIIIAIPVFGALDKLPIRLWDESRLATNAYEMSKGATNFLIPTFDYAPDMWNTKPPFLIWIQSLMIKLIGFNPLALRIPIALAIAFTTLALFRFLKKFSGEYVWAFIASIIFISNFGIIREHVSRTGDYDALLILFTTLSSLSIFQYTQTKRNKFIFLFFGFLFLAVLTKSIAGLLFLPAIAIYLLIRKELIPLLKNKWFHLGFLVFLTPVLGYYLLREHYNPGYWRAVMQNELGGRYLSTLEDHKEPFGFYFNLIVEQRFSYWFVLFVIGTIIGLANKNKKVRNLILFLTMNIVIFFLIISIGQTKLLWYDAPIYSFMAIIASLPVQQLFYSLKKKAKITPYFALILITIVPYSQTVQFVLESKEHPELQREHAISRFLIGGMKGNHPINGYKLVSNDYIPHTMSYVYMALEKGYNISRIFSIEVQESDTVIVENEDIKAKLYEQYNVKQIYSENFIDILALSKK